MADKVPLSAYIPFESTDVKNHHNYLILFNGYPKGELILINPQSILRMREEKCELSSSNLTFESEIQIKQLFKAWCLKVIELSGLTKKFYQATVKKAVTLSRLLSLTRHHQDLEFLLSRWSIETRTFLAT